MAAVSNLLKKEVGEMIKKPRQDVKLFPGGQGGKTAGAFGCPQKETGRVGEEPGQPGERRKWYMNFD